MGFSPLAISLYDAVQEFSSSALDSFLIGWRNDLRNEFLNDPQGRLGRTYPTLARQIPDTFPEPKALQLYCCPLTSQAADLSFTPNYSDWLVPGIPSTEELAPLCDSFFGWGPDILKHMANHVWEGQFVRQLIQVFIYLYGNRKLFMPSLRSDSIRYPLELSLALRSALHPCDTFQGLAKKLKQPLASASTRFKFGCHRSQARHLTLFKTAILPQKFMEVLFR